MNAENWCVYLILCDGGSLYCGISNHPAARFQAHRSGKGAKYTRIRKPLAMRVVTSGLTRSGALQQEAAVKKLPTEQKHLLWAQGEPV
ncbi:GIY-YIG nuclease family protein [Neisseria sp.]|uniref:GIY-YIG nuclease family protein n=1 Tax=Neisseria sp. TaxID=192066 RepID=UPI0035A1AEB1